MSALEFIAKIVEFTAWPSTVVLLVFLQKKPISAAISRLARLKHGDTELTFSEINKKLIEENPPAEEKKKLTNHQIISENVGKHGYYKLYSNGILVQKFKVFLRAGTRTQEVAFPIAFPNELLSIQFFGDLGAKVTTLKTGIFEISVDPSSSDRSLEIIASGM